MRVAGGRDSARSVVGRRESQWLTTEGVTRTGGLFAFAHKLRVPHIFDCYNIHMDPDISAEQLEGLLLDAKQAHGAYEEELGEVDENWARWYAEYIVQRLSEEV